MLASCELCVLSLESLLIVLASLAICWSSFSRAGFSISEFNEPERVSRCAWRELVLLGPAVWSMVKLCLLGQFDRLIIDACMNPRTSIGHVVKVCPLREWEFGSFSPMKGECREFYSRIHCSVDRCKFIVNDLSLWRAGSWSVFFDRFSRFDRFS